MNKKTKARMKQSTNSIFAICKRNVKPIVIVIYLLLLTAFLFLPFYQNKEILKKAKIIVYESADDADKDRGQLSLDETRIQYQVIRSSPER